VLPVILYRYLYTHSRRCIVYRLNLKVLFRHLRISSRSSVDAHALAGRCSRSRLAARLLSCFLVLVSFSPPYCPPSSLLTHTPHITSHPSSIHHHFSAVSCRLPLLRETCIHKLLHTLPILTYYMTLTPHKLLTSLH
jgi:hypothetical protein